MRSTSLKFERPTPAGYAILGILLAVVVFLSVLPVWYEGYRLTQLTEIMKFIVLAVAWVLFSAPTGYMSLANAAFFGVGFYIAAALSGIVPFVALILVAGAVAFVLALMVGALTLRLRGVYFCIFTFGLVLLVSSVVREVERQLSGTRGRFVSTESIDTVYWAILTVCVLTIVVAWLIRRSRHGLALTAIGQYEEAAGHSGINVVRTKVMVFAVSAIFMGMAGAVIATRRAYVDPTVAFNLNQSFLPVLMALFGGTVYLAGPIIGAIVFALIREELSTTWPEMFQVIFGAILIISILFLPGGIVGLAVDIWRGVKGERPLDRATILWCMILPPLGWLAVLLRLVISGLVRMRGLPMPEVTMEGPLTWRQLVIVSLTVIGGPLLFLWYVGTAFWRKLIGEASASA